MRCAQTLPGVGRFAIGRTLTHVRRSSSKRIVVGWPVSKMLMGNVPVLERGTSGLRAPPNAAPNAKGEDGYQNAEGASRSAASRKTEEAKRR